jgi:HAD superfamily hydrolase (TIGR01509 family)
VIFLDDGGVMNDNRLRGAQWYKMVAEFFVPKLGGTPEDWAAANARVMTRMLDADAWRARLDASSDYASFDRRYHVDWLRWMCDLVGVPAPADDECIALARDAYGSITPRVRAAFPGAVTAIRTLHRHGYVLHTASGESSEDLDGYLRGMGVRGCFGHLYGPDLVDAFKPGPRYYRRIFADAGVAPSDALVVDDNADATGWAAEAGARTVLIGVAPPTGKDATPCLGSLAGLPALLERLG